MERLVALSHAQLPGDLLQQRGEIPARAVGKGQDMPGARELNSHHWPLASLTKSLTAALAGKTGRYFSPGHPTTDGAREAFILK